MEKQLMITDEVLADLKASGICSIDAEWDPDAEIHEHDFELWGCGLSYFKGDEIIAHWVRLREDIQKLLNFVCEEQIPVVAHFGQADITAFLGARYDFPKDPDVRCTAIAFNMLYDELPESFLNLKKVLVPRFLNYTREGYMEASQDGPDTERFEIYAKYDVIDQIRLYKIAEEKLKALQLFSTYLLITKSIVPFSEMIMEGMPFCIDEAENLYHEFRNLQDKLEQSIYERIGRVNLASPTQLTRVLYKECKYYVKGLRKTAKGQIKTDAENIEKLAVKYPVCEMISAWRTCSKMIATYIDPFTEMYDKYGRVYDYFYLTGKTGRTSTKRFQLIPRNLGKNIRHSDHLKAEFSNLKLRRMFKAPEGKKLVVADYSSLEYRFAAIVAPEPAMIEMYQTYVCGMCNHTGKSNIPVKICPKCGETKNFKHGQDLHAAVRDAANAVGAGIDRDKAKNVSFCTIFNGTAFRLASMLALPVTACEKIQNSLFSKFPGIKQWHERTEKDLETKGYVKGIFGRRRKVDLKKRLEGKPSDKHVWIRKGCINELVNFPCQGGGCILGQIALRNTRNRLKKEGLWDRAKIICFIHDEIVIECDEDIAEQVLDILKYEMEHAVELPVPFSAEGSTAINWNDAK
jgi:DNA polymerase-1